MPTAPTQQIHSSAVNNRFGVLPAAGTTSFTSPVDGTLEISGAISTTGVLFYCELPALTATQLPNGQTITVSLVEGNDPTFATQVVTTTQVGVLTGVGVSGSAKAVFATRPAAVGGRYIGFKAVASAGAAASGVAFALGVAKT